MPSTASLRFSSPPNHPIAPPAPCPWLWRCHSCHIWYRLSTTRRCLECSHEFCLGEGQSSFSSSSSSKKRKRTGGGPCRAEFDYVGWAARGAWKRTMLLNTRSGNGHVAPSFSSRLRNTSTTTTTTTSTSKQQRRLSLITPKSQTETSDGGLLLPSRQRWLSASALATVWGNEHRALDHGIGALVDRFAEKKEALFVRRRHNCWLHCDFPSECHHAVYKAQQEGRPVLAKARALDEAYLAKIADGGKKRDKRNEIGAEKRGASVVARKVVVSRLGGFVATGASAMDGADDSGDSDSDPDSDSDLEEDELSPPGHVEVFDGREPTPASRVLTPLDTEGDFSYTAFKKAAGVPSAAVEIHTDNDHENNRISPPTTPLVSCAVALPIAIPNTLSTTLASPLSAEGHQEEDLDAFLTGLYKNAIQEGGRLGAKRAHIVSASSSSSSVAAVAAADLLQSFTPFEAFLATTTHTNLTTLVDEDNSSQQLDQAYSTQAWFSTSTHHVGSTESEHAISMSNTCESSTRASRSEHMLTLLSRRTSPNSPTHPAGVSAFDDWDDEDEDEDKNSDTETAISTSTSTTLTTSPPSSPPTLLSSSSDESVDGDGDDCMQEDEDKKGFPIARGIEEEVGDKSVARTDDRSDNVREPMIEGCDDENGERSLDALFRMRNSLTMGAF
ncbi:unnamed protein product [Discula destructiva]